jgi:hypothetical protein
MVIISNLHVGHASDLENFIGTDAPIFVYNKKLAHICCSVVTRSDWGVYLPHYLKLSGELNWKTLSFQGAIDFLLGIVLHLAVSHTPGMLMMELNLEESGPWLFTSDLYHVKDNYERTPQG